MHEQTISTATRAAEAEGAITRYIEVQYQQGGQCVAYQLMKSDWIIDPELKKEGEPWIPENVRELSGIGLGEFGDGSCGSIEAVASVVIVQAIESE